MKIALHECLSVSIQPRQLRIYILALRSAYTIYFFFYAKVYLAE